MKAAFLVRTFDVGGSERQLVALTQGLVARGHRALVAVLEGGGTLVPDLRAANVTVCEATAHGIRELPVRLPSLVATLRRWRPDVLHAYLPFANVLAPALRPLLRGTPIVFGIRVVAPERDPGDPRVRALYRAETIAARFADAVIANSDAARAHVVDRGFPAGRVHVVPNGIDTERFRFDATERARVRADWSIGDGEVLVGRVGRMRPNKGYDMFLHAATVAASRCPALRFVCVGDGPQRAELESLARSLDLDGQLVWAGERSDMTAVMSALDIMVSSSRVESFPNVIGEAMACGVPCVVTDAGDSAGIVGDTGLVVPPGDQGGLGNAIVELAARPPPGREALRARVEAKFGVEAMVTQTEQVLETVVRSRST